ncbi:hypothetical protein AHAS_Ahas06G0135700 [Arachis hypogaea]
MVHDFTLIAEHIIKHMDNPLYVSEVKGHYALLSALVERWRPNNHIFCFLVGEVTVIQEDVTHIFGLPINGYPMMGGMDSSHSFLVKNYKAIFGRQPGSQITL